MKQFFEKYKMTFWFIVFGSYWFIPAINTSDSSIPAFFIGTYYFLPGVALPLIVFLTHKKSFDISFLYYEMISLVIYYSVVWIFSLERVWNIFRYIAPFLGGFLFIIATNRLMIKSYKVGNALIGGILSSICFTILLLVNDKISFAITCFLWTLFVGLLIDYSINNQSKKQGQK